MASVHRSHLSLLIQKVRKSLEAGERCRLSILSLLRMPISPLRRRLKTNYLLNPTTLPTQHRNPTWGLPRIAAQINLAFAPSINNDVVRRILACATTEKTWNFFGGETYHLRLIETSRMIGGKATMKCIGISLVLWLLASNAFAQGGRGAVTGVVIDPDGNIDYGRETDCSSDCLAIRFEVRSQRTSCDSRRRSICSANIRSTTRAPCLAQERDSRFNRTRYSGQSFSV